MGLNPVTSAPVKVCARFLAIAYTGRHFYDPLMLVITQRYKYMGYAHLSLR